MDADAVNLIQAKLGNNTLSLCTEPYFTLTLIKDIILLVYIIPTTIMVTMELFKKKFNKKTDQSITSSYSMSEVFLFQINYINISYSVYHLFNLLQEMGYCQFNSYLLFVFYAPGHSAEPIFLTVACMDWYIAVVHPVAYIASKNYQYRGIMLSVAIWVYASIIEVIVFVFKLSIFHPVCMLSFYISLPTMLYCNIATLKVLHSSGPERDGKAAKNPNLVKRKAFRIILGILVVMMMYNVPQAFYMTYRFLDPSNMQRVLCFELPLVQIVPTCCEFATPLIYLYSLGKLGI